MIDISEDMRSDHSLITLQVMTDDFHRGPGFWKFNLFLLQDDLFVENTKHSFLIFLSLILVMLTLILYGIHLSVCLGDTA